MYGQMTAGSWIYIGTQGILQGTYETFAAVAAKQFGGTLAGTITLTAGCGGMGGAQPLAVTMNDGVCLVIDVDPHALERRIEHRYLDVRRRRPGPRARSWPSRPATSGEPLSIGVVGNAAELVPELLAEACPIDIVTDQTSAHDPLSYLPDRRRLRATCADYAAKKPAEFTDRARESMAQHVEAMVGFMDAGAEVFDYGNSIRGEAQLAGYERGVRLPRLRAPPTSGRCSARARARSAGRRCPATRPTSPPPTRPCSTSSPRTSRCPAGSGWPASGSTSRACRPASAGSATASATRPG